MLMQKEREAVVEYGKLLITSGLTKGTGGNVSVANRELGYFALSPSGKDYFTIKPEEVAILDFDGKIIEAPFKPSTEHELHRMIYVDRPEINGVIHAHTNYATTLGCMRWELPALHYLVALAGKNVRCAEYATFGTKELAVNVVKAMKDRYAAIMANHGVITGGRDVANAFKKLEEIEYCCQLYWQAKAMGVEPVLLSDEEMEKHLVLFKTYGDAAVPKN